jgi:hypothetical protein
MPRGQFRNWERLAFGVWRSPFAESVGEASRECWAFWRQNMTLYLGMPANGERRTLAPSLRRNQKMLPVIDIVSVPDKGTDGQLSRGLRFLFQLETHFLRQTISLQAVNPLVRQNAVLPGSQPAARSRYDMIDIAFVRSEFLAGVLAVSTVPFPDSLSR